MEYKSILITGGAGFVGSNLAFKLKSHYPNVKIFVLDNLKRRGSELNVPRLKAAGISFIHGDIRNKEDFPYEISVDLIIECSAEPSVLSGIYDSPQYLINTNLGGTVNCLEFARTKKAHMIFLSTSRVYPIKELNSLKYEETETRFALKDIRGIYECFPMGKHRSLYGTTKLCSEFLLQEYINTYGIKGVINRCGVIAGPWQMGKVDQGVAALWMAAHYWKKPLTYIGFGGQGKQVRDFLHIDDLFNAVVIQINDIDKYNGRIFNLGGGLDISLSLKEMTKLCQRLTGNKISIKKKAENRPNDIRIYISDYSKFRQLSGWEPKKSVEDIFTDIYKWLKNNDAALKNIL